MDRLVEKDTARTTALLLMDFHTAIVGWHGDSGQRAVAAAAMALTRARESGAAVYHILPGYREHYPELPDGLPFDEVKQTGLFRDAGPGRGIAAPLQPRSDEPIVTKFRYSPFFANDLLLMMRLRRIECLALVGIATRGVVLSAVRDAWDLDFRITVLEDGCADSDPAVHEFLLGKIIPAQATVTTVDDWHI